MNGYRIPRRTLVRISSFTAAIVLLSIGFAIQQNAVAADYRAQIENSYARSLGELSSYLVNISDDLDKGKYIGTSGHLAQMSARIWRESGGAKEALSTLPVNELHLDGTYKFLSQVGDYAMALSKKIAAGEALTPEEQQNAEALRTYAARLRDYVDAVQQQVRGGQVDVAALRALEKRGDETGGTQLTGLAAGFEDMEQTMTGYPTLIYDGPFSDHLLNRKPRLTRYTPAVSPEDALENAAKAARVSASELKRGDDENSNMPSYTFGAKGLCVGVTKAGGYVSYLLNDRAIGEERLRRDAVLQRGAQYLEELGFANMRATYYEKADGICTINFAATEGDVILYTDLIKVGVAMDDGGIVFYDARGYITNHYERGLEKPTLTAQDAAKSVSQNLTILSSRPALIPTSGQNEVLTYEFQTQTKEEPLRKLLVYVNAKTGAEENLLLLLETPEGTMTK